MVALVGQTKDKNGSDSSAVSQGEESHLESGGRASDILDSKDQEFLMNHIRKGTRVTYCSGWYWVSSSYKGQKLNAE